MRIAIVLESYFPNVSGVTIFTKRLAAHLAQTGHDVRIFTTLPASQKKEEKDPAGFLILRLPGWPNPFRKGLRVSYPWTGAMIGRIFADWKPDVVHLQDPALLSRRAFLQAKKRRVPVIMHHHFSMEFVLSYWKWIPPFLPVVRAVITHRARTFYNKCALVITPTEYVRRTLLGWGIKAPVQAISNGIELSRFKPGTPEENFFAKYDLAQEDHIALYLGRLDKDKNIQTLVRAIPKILEMAKKEQRDASLKFVFVGDGTDRKKLEADVAKESWRHHVRFLGYIPHDGEAVPKLYQASRFYWIASTIETQSLTTLEAMASGLPIISANAGALPEIVHDHKNGFLLAPYDADAFALAAFTLFQDQELAKRFSERSLKVASEHDIAKSFQKILDAYKIAIQQRD